MGTLTHRKTNLLCYVDLFFFIAASIHVFLSVNIDSAYAQSHPWQSFRGDGNLSGRADLVGPFRKPQLLWSKPHGNGINLSPVVASDGTVIFTSNGHSVIHFLDPITGNSLHDFQQNFHFDAPPTLGAGSVLYIGASVGGTNKYYLLAINTKTASLYWQYEISGPMYHPAVVDNLGRVFLATSSGELYCFRDQISKGDTLWVRPLNGKEPNSAPVIGSDKIYVVTDRDLFVYNFSGDSQKNKDLQHPWKISAIDLIGWAALAPGNDKRLYLGAKDSSVVIEIHADNGAFRNKSPDLGIGPLCLPAFRKDGSLILSGHINGELIALKSDLSRDRSFSLGEPYTNLSIIDKNDRVYLVSSDKRFGLFMLDSTWKYTALDSTLAGTKHGRCGESLAFGKEGTVYIPGDGLISAVRETPYADTLMPLSDDSTEGCVKSPLADSVTVLVKDQYGNNFKDHPVVFSILTGGGRLNDGESSVEIRTNTLGLANVQWTLGDRAGEQKLEVSTVLREELPFKIEVAIFASAPQIESNNHIEFEDFCVGDSFGRNDTIRTLGICDLTIDRIIFLGDPDFSLPKDIKFPITISAGGDTILPIIFSPIVLGDRNATMQIWSNDSSHFPFLVNLHGIGVIDCHSQECVRIASDTLKFTSVCVGGIVTLEDTVYNDCPDDVVVTLSTVSGGRFKPEQSEIVVPANGFAIARINFCPDTVGVHSAIIQIRRKGVVEHATTINLFGEGIAVNITGANALDFGIVPSHTRKDTTYWLYNNSICALNIKDVRLEGENANAFRYQTEIKGSTIAPGDSGKIDLQFCPTADETLRAQLLIINKDRASSPFSVGLQGIGTLNSLFLRVVPGALDFGEVCRGAKITRLDTLFNDCFSALEVDISTTDNAFKPETSKVIVPAQGMVPISIDLCPTAAGDNFANLEIRLTETSEILSFALRGKGLSARLEGEDTLRFGLVPVNGCDEKSYPFQNVGECDLVIDSLVIVNNEDNVFKITNDEVVGDSIAHSGWGSIGLSFCPKTPVEKTAELRIYSNAIAAPEFFRVTLIGEGTTDTQPPPPPEQITISPTYWSCENNFYVCWQNPFDESGIDSVYYKIGSPPNSSSDYHGSFKVAEITCHNFTDKLTLAGAYAIYLWLSDSAGNADFKNNASDVAKFDNLEPEIYPKPLGVVPFNTEVRITASVNDQHSGARPGSMKLIYRRGGEPDAVLNTQSFQDSAAVIPAFYVGDRGVEYAIEVEDNACKMTRWPAPDRFASIRVEIPENHYNVLHLGGNLSSSYKIRGAPLELFDTTIDDFFSRSAVMLGDSSDIRVWEVDPNRAQDEFPFQDYLPNRAFGRLDSGRGVLLITSNTIALHNGLGWTIPTTVPFEFEHVKLGWNLIANPFSFEIPVQNLSVRNRLCVYEGTWQAIQANAKIKPWQGYLLLIDAGEDLPLTLIPSEEIRSRHELGDLQSLDWVIQIMASSGEAKDVDNFLGVARDAEPEWDEHEILEAPRFAKYVRVYFDQRQWANKPGRYTTDIRPVSSEGQEWMFFVETNSGSSQAFLKFDSLSTVPKELEIRLHDITLNRQHDLRREPRYEFQFSVTTTQKFHLLVGSNSFMERRLPHSNTVVNEFTLEQNYPNPFNPTTTIRFGLPVSAQVSLQIYNVKGERVRSILNNAHEESGYHDVVWDGRDEYGKVVANGLYLCRMQANQTILLRKLTVLK